MPVIFGVTGITYAQREEASMTRGQRVELVRMSGDPDPIPPGSRGTVSLVDAGGTVHVQWDSGRVLGMIPGKDIWRVIHD